MRMKQSKAITWLVVIAMIAGLLGFTVLKGFGPTGTGAAKNIILGLDLEGGVSITYKVVGKASAEDVDDTVYKLQKRVENYSTEASVYKEGTNRISIEIPGVNDADTILNDLGKPGSLYFISQKDSEGNTNYNSDSESEDGYKLEKTIEELEEDGSIVLTGAEVKSAEAATQQNDLKNTENVVKLTLNEKGTKAFAEATKKAKEDEESIAIYYDEEFVSVPTVQAEIKDGNAVITGMKDAEEAEQLASTIRIGGLKVTLEELRSNVVGAQLGQDAIKTSVLAGILGLIIIFLFLLFVYRLPGFASSISLLIYTGLVLLTLNAFNITLTLPGIAGIILSIGMAVDANVIIFARVKEEIASGKAINTALKNGFDKALSAIVDGNVTTLIAAAILWARGSGSVKGFAQTLTIGIIFTLIQALIITRLLIYALYSIGLKSSKLYGTQKERNTINFIAKKKVWFSVAAVFLLVTIGSMITYKAMGKGILNFSLEFKGGTSMTVTMNDDYSINEIDSEVVPVIEDEINDSNIQIQKVSGSDDIIIKTRVLDLEEREGLINKLADEFDIDKETVEVENISSTISKEMRSDAIISLIIAGILMLLYIWIRFSDIRFATSAVLALAHDVLIVIGCYALLRISVGNTFIACLLTIVGYSINATIVIFDRIRELLKTVPNTKNLDDLVNKAITYTLTRSLYTTFTTFIMVFMLYILGVSSMRDFALPLMVGVIAGGFSSVFLTGSIWYTLRTKIMKKK